MTSRTDRDPKNVCSLKPDFFTSSIQRNPSTGRDVPLSVSTILSQKDPDVVNPAKRRRSDRPDESLTGEDVPGQEAPDTINPPKRRGSARLNAILTGNDPGVLKNDGLFKWEDVQDIWEIKSSSNDLDKHRWWANLTLKASEVLRFQWHRQFVRGFLVCGTYLRMFFFQQIRCTSQPSGQLSE
jgi:hypothetical protein